MRSSIKKFLVITSISIFSLGIVWGALAFSDITNRNSYKSSGEAALKVSSPDKPRASKTLEEWEKTLIEREVPNFRDVNYTQEVARQVTAEFLRARSSLSAEEIDEEELVKQVLAQVIPEKQELNYEDYKVSDLKISSENTLEAFRNYGNNLGEASAKNVYDTSSGTETLILDRALKLGREKEFEKLKPIIENYQNLIDDFLNIEVPTELVSVHLNIVNSFGRMKSSVQEFDIFFQDPARGLFVMSAYAGYGLDLQEYIRELNQLMKDKGVTFKEVEPGFAIERAAGFSAEQIQP